MEGLQAAVATLVFAVRFRAGWHVIVVLLAAGCAVPPRPPARTCL